MQDTKKNSLKNIFKQKRLLPLFALSLLFLAIFAVILFVSQSLDNRNQAASRKCLPRPACLDSLPPCRLPEPVMGWCKSPTSASRPACRPRPDCLDYDPPCQAMPPKEGFCPSSSLSCQTCVSENKRSLCLDRLRKTSFCTNQADIARDPNRVCVSCGTTKPSTTPITPVTRLNIPLGIPIYSAENVDFFNQVAENYDIVSYKSATVDFGDKQTVGEKSLTYGQETIEEIIALAKAKGIKKIAFNLEGRQSMEELVAAEKKFYDAVQPYGIEATFAPTVVNLANNMDNYGGSFALYADVLGLQSQRYQLEPDYEKIVEDLIYKIKQINPKVKVNVQVSVNPPAKRDITAAEVIANIEAIKDKADGIRIFYSPTSAGRTATMEEVFRYFRG